MTKNVNQIIQKNKGKELQFFAIMVVLLLYLVAFLCDSPRAILEGMIKIILSRDALITDYFALAGYGASFFNAATVTLICIILIFVEKIPFTGPTMAAIFMNIGYGFWGKNVVNILPILLGTWIYARLHHARLGRYIYTALFGTCLAPFVTEMIFMLPFSHFWNMVMAVLLGIMVGFVLPPLSTHVASMHMGYSLFNVGFSGGILAFVLVCIFRSFGLESEPKLVWQYGTPLWLAVGSYVFFGLVVIAGYFMSDRKISKLFAIFRHPGRAVADFVLMDGVGPTLMNMGLIGILSLTYIMLIGGDLSGPVIGTICAAFGFAAFGAHLRNFPPVLIGVFLFTVMGGNAPSTPAFQLAAIFGVGLAPIAGQFGVIPGIISGMLHTAIVMYTGDMYGGLNLYNNGFSAGWVAIFMVPILESFMKHFEYRKNYHKLKKEKKLKQEP